MVYAYLGLPQSWPGCLFGVVSTDARVYTFQPVRSPLDCSAMHGNPFILLIDLSDFPVFNSVFMNETTAGIV